MCLINHHTLSSMLHKILQIKKTLAKPKSKERWNFSEALRQTEWAIAILMPVSSENPGWWLTIQINPFVMARLVWWSKRKWPFPCYWERHQSSEGKDRKSCFEQLTPLSEYCSSHCIMQFTLHILSLEPGCILQSMTSQMKYSTES